MDRELVRGLHERAARALPAVHVERRDGWWLRRSAGSAWWVGSVLPHADAGPEELLHRVAGAEAFHAEHGTPARFQIGPPACPDTLDAVLTARGYRRECPMSLQVATVGELSSSLAGDLVPAVVEPEPTEPWFAVWHGTHGRPGERRADRGQLARVQQRSAYAHVDVGGRVVAVGRVVVDDGWAGIFGMATLPDARGSGAGRSVLAAMAGWAAAQGVGRLYLQVERDNRAAVGLYERAGFREACPYHYRTAG